MTNRFEIVKPEDAEHADTMVCRRLTSPLLMPDNLIDLCATCGEAIQHRPNAPTTPTKICDACAIPLLDAEYAKGELVTMITETTADEFLHYIKRKKAH